MPIALGITSCFGGVATGRNESTQGFKVLQSWDDAHPVVDESKPESVEEYVEQCRIINRKGGMMSEAAKKATFIRYLKSVRLREKWMALKSFRDGAKTAEEFVEEILTLISRVQGRRFGSTAELDEFCKDESGIRIEELSRLRRFGLGFRTLYSKLSKHPVVLSDREACDKFLSALEGSFRNQVKMVLSNARLMNKHVKALRPRLSSQIHVQNASPVQISGKGDPLTLNELVELVESMAVRETVSEENVYTEMLKESELRKVRDNSVEERVKRLQCSIWDLRDLVDFVHRQSSHDFDRALEAIQLAITEALQPEWTPPQVVQMQPSTYRDNPPHLNLCSVYTVQLINGDCRYCHGSGHWSRECQVKEKHVEMGMVTVEKEGRMRLADGNLIPSGQSAQAQRVEEYWARRNRAAKSESCETGSDASVSLSSLSNAYPSDYSQGAIDEICSLKAQIAKLQLRDQSKN